MPNPKNKITRIPKRRQLTLAEAEREKYQEIRRRYVGAKPPKPAKIGPPAKPAKKSSSFTRAGENAKRQGYTKAWSGIVGSSKGRK